MTSLSIWPDLWIITKHLVIGGRPASALNLSGRYGGEGVAPVVMGPPSHNGLTPADPRTCLYHP